MLRLADITYRIERRLLLEGASATIPAGHKVGIVGRNGVGKTTLLKLLLGEIQPQSGHVHRQGRIGVLRQEVRSPPGTTVADQLGIADGLGALARTHRVWTSDCNDAHERQRIQRGAARFLPLVSGIAQSL